jgi:UDP-GlcNAc:undecaprenyl-phosphate GlcNAc-1-phosphate transferase
VFALDAVLMMMLLTASRFSFRMFRRLFPVAHGRAGSRVLIYGAGDGGELVFRELRNNPQYAAVPVAFVDDDPAKSGRLLHGLRVYSGALPLIDTCKRLHIDEVIISTGKLPRDRMTSLVGACAAAGLRVSRAAMSIQPLSPSDFGWVMASDQLAAGAPVVAPLGTNLVHPSPRHITTDH